MTKKGKMLIKVWPVSREEYDIIVKRVNMLAWAKGLKYHAKFIPGTVKK